MTLREYLASRPGLTIETVNYGTLTTDELLKGCRLRQMDEPVTIYPSIGTFAVKGKPGFLNEQIRVRFADYDSYWTVKHIPAAMHGKAS